MIHPNRHVINNIIGMPDMWIDIGKPIQLADLDTVILASDGLWDNLYRDEVAGLVGNRSLMESANGIFRMATDRMKREPIQNSANRMISVSFSIDRTGDQHPRPFNWM